ncbi:MAG TPA: hypothetical protein DCR71_00200 [Dehalococcoidia bacterium]|nr:hypothetical protein [Dehalococcoidia bacterium]
MVCLNCHFWHYLEKDIGHCTMLETERFGDSGDCKLFKQYEPDFKEECMSCIHKSRRYCPCQTIETIPVSNAEMFVIIKNISPDKDRLN